MNIQNSITVLDKLALDCHLEGIIRKSNHFSTSNNRTAFVLETQDLSQMCQGLLPGSRCLKGIMGAEKACYEGFII